VPARGTYLLFVSRMCFFEEGSSVRATDLP
jgi:hypothetical protein